MDYLLLPLNGNDFEKCKGALAQAASFVTVVVEAKDEWLPMGFALDDMECLRQAIDVRPE